MSYILEALKKSDPQRQRGTTPTLTAAQVNASAPKQHFSAYYGFIAAVLLCAGIVIGWLRPWQAEEPIRANEPIAANSSLSISNPAPLTFQPNQPETARITEQKLPVQNTSTEVQAVSRAESTKPNNFASVSPEMISAVVPVPATSSKKQANTADVAQEQKIIPMAELPNSIQQEIPVMAIQLHSYSSKPSNSIVSINSRMMKEGESLKPGLKLEQITPDGVIFSYKGYRFQHGIW